LTRSASAVAADEVKPEQFFAWGPSLVELGSTPHWHFCRGLHRAFTEPGPEWFSRGFSL